MEGIDDLTQEELQAACLMRGLSPNISAESMIGESTENKTETSATTTNDDDSLGKEKLKQHLQMWLNHSASKYFRCHSNVSTTLIMLTAALPELVLAKDIKRNDSSS
jgi:hypothetical protein